MGKANFRRHVGRSNQRRGISGTQPISTQMADAAQPTTQVAEERTPFGIYFAQQLIKQAEEVEGGKARNYQDIASALRAIADDEVLTILRRGDGMRDEAYRYINESVSAMLRASVKFHVDTAYAAAAEEAGPKPGGRHNDGAMA